eukprot:Rmarinus@m.24608
MTPLLSVWITKCLLARRALMIPTARALRVGCAKLRQLPRIGLLIPGENAASHAAKAPGPAMCTASILALARKSMIPTAVVSRSLRKVKRATLARVRSGRLHTANASR